jgi:hypothetical protein
MDTSKFVPEHLDRTRLLANLADAKSNLAMYEQASVNDDTEESREYWAGQAERERSSIKLLEELLDMESAG